MPQKTEGPEAVTVPMWRVEVSFYVEASTAADARTVVEQGLNSAPIQKLVGETIGRADVHEAPQQWDLNG